MDEQMAKKIASQFDFKTMEILNQWIEYRIGVLRYATEALNSDEKTIRFAQGGIDELKVLKKIRDYALQVLEQE